MPRGLQDLADDYVLTLRGGGGGGGGGGMVLLI